MLNGKRVIGVCITKIQDYSRLDYISMLYRHAKEQDCKLIVFNSFLDFFNNDDLDEGAKAVYDIMNYDILDAVIVVYDCFCNKSVADKIIADTRSHNVPVVILNGKSEGCISVNSDYSIVFKRLLDHVIKEHGVTDTFFIAGKPEDDPDSVIRIQCYKEVLEENGLSFDENKLEYGYYWNEPAEEIAKRLTDGGKKPPQAIFCANDYMAVAVCETLKKRGFKIPDDIIVTGFDGIPVSRHCIPQLSTCRTNIEELAKASLKAVDNAISGTGMDILLRTEHETVFSESCGCQPQISYDHREYVSDLFHINAEMEAHEDYMYSWIDKTINVTDIASLYRIISDRIISDSFVCLKSSYINSIQDNSVGENTVNTSPDELIVISSKYTRNDSDKIRSIRISEMAPNLERWVEDDKLYVINSLYIGKEVCGFYALRTTRADICRHKLKRVHKALNIALNICTNYFKQVNLRLKVENAALLNPITGLPNIKGAARWFEKFSAKEENHNKCVAFSVYGLPKFVYIYENFGIETSEKEVRLVSERLRAANDGGDCFIAHISEDEFLIVNYADDGYAIGDIINKATTTFFGLNDSYNANSGNEYFVEVNCGCTIANPGWSGELEGFIGFANNEMYMNRLKMGTDTVVKKYENPGEYYKAFDLLVKKNLFTYHFQPIVSAKSGEIYAYEALMRTDASIGMNPLQVLDTAKEYNRLYDIEKATMFNIIGRYANERDSFGDAKVFINTIPGYFLNDEDLDDLSRKYGEHMGHFVFELTEQDTVSDEELSSIHRLMGINENHIAIDDFGTGHSNIVNLMRYSPAVIKIDRFLISDIHKNQNKQMFVRSTIEFAKLNNIKVLAEGVETSNELRMVIDLGVDLIQGFYTGRPAPQPVQAIAVEIKKEIVESNPLYGQRL